MKMIFDSQYELEQYIDFIDKIDRPDVDIFHCFVKERDSCPTYHSGCLPCSECFRLYGNYKIKED